MQVLEALAGEGGEESPVVTPQRPPKAAPAPATQPTRAALARLFTNNELEQFLGAVKYHYRRTYGRKSTAGGPLESFAPYPLELWPRLHEELPLAQVIEGISPEELQKARQRLVELSEPARQRRAFLRKPMKVAATSGGGLQVPT